MGLLDMRNVYTYGQTFVEINSKIVIDFKNLQNYYIIDNHTMNETCLKFNISFTQLRTLIDHFRPVLNKTKEMIESNVRKKQLAIKQDKNKVNEINFKRKQTFLQKYGVEAASQIPGSSDKVREACREKYGVNNAAQSQQAKEAYKKHMQEKYGCDNSFQADEVKEKIKKTCKEKYGSENIRNSEYYDNLKEKYGCEWSRKGFEVRKNNHSLNTSKPEEVTYIKLCSIFGKENIEREYNTKITENSDRYPFYCDFYIKPLDMFVELNLHYTHGPKPYDPEDKDCQSLLKKWKEKKYLAAIDVWTARDPRKITCAKDHNLNYKMVYNVKELDSWLAELSKYSVAHI